MLGVVSEAANMMSIATPISRPSGYASGLSTDYADQNEGPTKEGSHTPCPFKKHPVTRDSVAARVVLASILPILESYGQSLASPESPFDERECPMLKCHQKLKTPWALINHLLFCPETPKGDINCQECSRSHEIKRLMSPVHLWRRLSGGKPNKRPNGASLDWPLAKRGRVEQLNTTGSCESLTVSEYLSEVNQHAAQGPPADAYELEAELAHLEASISDFNGSVLDSTDYSTTRHPLKKSWCGPSFELAAGSVRATAERVAVEADTPLYATGISVAGASASQLTVPLTPQHPWIAIPLDTAGFGSSAAETIQARPQDQQPSPDFMPLRSSSQSQQHPKHDVSHNMSRLDPLLRYASGFSLAPGPEDGDPLEVEDDGDGHWYIGPDYGQQAVADYAYQAASTGTMARPAAYVANPDGLRLSVVTQPMSAHAYRQENGFGALTNSQLMTPLSTSSGPSATSSRGARWPFNSASSSASASTKFESPTSSSFTSSEAKRRASGAGRSEPSVLVSPLTDRSVNSGDNISPSADSNQSDVCPHCDYVPKGARNHRTHMKRHIKTHELGHELQCQVHGCGSTFAAGRTDNLKQHMKKVHSQLDATVPKPLEVPNMTPTSASPATSFGYGDRRRESRVFQGRAGHLEANDLHRDSSILTGISSDRGTQLDSLQTPGGLSPVEEGKDDLSKGNVRPSDIGPTGWNDWDVPRWI